MYYQRRANLDDATEIAPLWIAFLQQLGLRLNSASLRNLYFSVQLFCRLLRGDNEDKSGSSAATRKSKGKRQKAKVLIGKGLSLWRLVGYFHRAALVYLSNNNTV